MNALRKILGANTDIAMVLLIVGVLMVLFTPIPSELLDFLILANFSFALLILLLTFYMAKPVEFSTFPSMLLIATLFRLSLNVAATRLILRDADAGRVIGAIGSYVVGGNYVIGLIVFFILIVVQYVVVTNGAQRVSEVAARFTLDSMPGQQMSIDADLNMGFIDQQEAQRRRKNISKEAAFYGAMDGASKFVKGDAVAGIIIMMINIVGGLVIGVMQLGMSWPQALQSYTLLTIGDGIVTQVPALVISVGTGLIVTRSASDDNLSLAAFGQITSYPRTMLLVALALAGLTALPGIPVIPALLLVLFYVAALLLKRSMGKASENTPQTENAEAAPTEGDAYAALAVEPIEVRFGALLGPLFEGDEAVFTERISTFRKQYAQESGLVLPAIRFRNTSKLGQQEYELAVYGVNVARGELQLDRTLAIHSGGDNRKLRGIETREPTYGLPAVWIEASERETARNAKFTLVDPPTVFMTHLSEVLRRQSANLLTRKELERLLGRVREQQPGLIEEFIPTSLSLSDVQRVLQNLLREKVSIRNLEAIVETLADRVRASKDPVLLTEMVRQRLAASICQSLAGNNAYLQVMTLDPSIEQRLMQNIRDSEAGGLAIEPQFAEQFVSRLAQQTEKMMKSNAMPVLICAPDLRRHIRALSERMAPHLRVLSLAEIPNTLELRAFGTVAL